MNKFPNKTWKKLPVNYEAQNDHVEMFELLLQTKANLYEQTRDRWDYDASHLAAANGQSNVIKILKKQTNIFQ